MSLPAGWTQHAWGLVDQFGTPRAPTDKHPYTGRCLEMCGLCKEKPCSKSNGHQWSCNCHFDSCAPRYHKNGSVTYGPGKGRP